MRLSTLNTRSKFWGVIGATTLFSIFPLQTFATPRPPGPPWPEEGMLRRLSFDEAYYSTNAVIDTSLWAESWSGYALSRIGGSVVPLTMPMATTNNWNMTPDQGSIRFWYAPCWNSDAGPGHEAVLAQLSVVSGQNSAQLWSLDIVSDGSGVALYAQGNEGVETCVAANISWASGQWHLITLNYSGSQTALYIDDILVSSGSALPSLQNSVAAANGVLTVGSALSGSQTSEGLIDEFTTFLAPEKGNSFLDYYTLLRPTVDLGPITAVEEAARQQRVASARAAKLQASSSLTSATSLAIALDAQPMDSQQGLTLLPPSFQGSNVLLSLQGGQTNESYNILFSPSLFDDMTSADWATAAYGVFGQTNFVFPAAGDIGFYRAQVVNGVPVWQLADPSNTNSGFLSLTINYPTNASVIH